MSVVEPEPPAKPLVLPKPRVLKIVPEIEVKVKASRVRGDERRGNFTSWSEQKKAADDLARRFTTHRLTVAFPSDGDFVDHDRVIYLHLKIQDASRFYKIILGQGLFGFEGTGVRLDELHDLDFQQIQGGQQITILD